MNEVLKKAMEEREEMEKTFVEGYKKLFKEKDEEIEKMINDKNQELKEAVKALEEERSEFEDLEYLNLALCIKLRQSNDEIEEARKELITGLRGCGENSAIGVKMMGDIDEKPFLKACEERFSGRNVSASELCSEWRENVRDSRWQPFKIQRLGDKIKDVVDEEDEKLKNLCEEWGEDVKNAVKTALEELNEFNASGRHPVPVLWNFQHGRRATLKEGMVAHMKHQIKNLKRKRT